MESNDGQLVGSFCMSALKIGGAEFVGGGTGSQAVVTTQVVLLSMCGCARASA